MEMLTSIAQSLGFNSTLFIHLACFAISYLCLYLLLFKPYSAALQQRNQRTIGQEAKAEAIGSELNELNMQYEKRARDINSQIAQIFSESRKTAQTEYDHLVDRARSQAHQAVVSAREQIKKQAEQSREVLSKQKSLVGAVIATKLSGKEISL